MQKDEPENLKDDDDVSHMEPAKFYGLFKTYCEIDLAELQYMHENLAARKTITDFDTQSILSTYLGLSVFSMEE